MRTILPLLVLFIWSAGCVDEEAPAKCREIGERYCEQHNGLCPMPTPQEACEDIYDEVATCDDALYLEEPDREDCLTAIDELEECPQALPGDCQGVVVLPPDDGEDDE